MMNQTSPPRRHASAIACWLALPAWAATVLLVPHGAAMSAVATCLAILAAMVACRSWGMLALLGVASTWAAGVVAADLTVQFDFFMRENEVARLPAGANVGTIVMGTMLWIGGMAVAAVACAPFIDAWDWAAAASARRAGRRSPSRTAHVPV